MNIYGVSEALVAEGTGWHGLSPNTLLNFSSLFLPNHSRLTHLARKHHTSVARVAEYVGRLKTFSNKHVSWYIFYLETFHPCASIWQVFEKVNVLHQDAHEWMGEWRGYGRPSPMSLLCEFEEIRYFCKSELFRQNPFLEKIECIVMLHIEK